MVKKVIIGGLVVALVGLAIGWKYVGAFLDGRKTTINSSTYNFVLDNSKSLDEIAEKLVDKEIISDKSSFMALAKFKNLTNEKLGSGMYKVASGTSFRALLNGFTLNSNGNGNAEVEVEVTFNNCATIHEMCVKASKNTLLDSVALENFILKESTLNKYDFSSETVPALFLPNSYRMYYDTSKEQFVERMAKEFKNFWTAERIQKLKKVGLKSPSEAVTLASIVYAEQSKNKSEWPIIARLYLNRVNSGMKLQSDPTFKFCWGDQLKGVQRLTYEHRNKDCPYNTYLYKGLPPGPISLPPTGVVDAVLNPDNNDFLFMCAQSNYDGLHDFAVDYATHDRNAKAFQSWLGKQLSE